MTARATQTLRERFAEAGLPFPSLPVTPAGDVRLRGDWHLTSRRNGAPPPSRIRDHVLEFQSGDAEDYVVVAHAGQGTNAWAVSYLTVRGPLGVFVQSAWGGAATAPDDAQREVARMSERFALADALLTTPTDRLGDGERLAVVDSDFGQQSWAVLRGDEPAQWTNSVDPLADARAYLGG